jgi:hypothetical protein
MSAELPEVIVTLRTDRDERRWRAARRRIRETVALRRAAAAARVEPAEAAAVGMTADQDGREM